MNVDILAFLLLAVLGVAAALLGGAYLVFRIAAGIVGTANRLVGPHHAIKPPRRRGSRRAALVCPEPGCRHVEHRNASFCSQCGASLSEKEPEDNPVTAG